MINFDEMVSNYLKREKRKKQIGRYYPSEIGGCLRKTWYSYKNPKELNPETIKIFFAGDMIHEFVVEVLKSEKNPHIELLNVELPFFVNGDGFVISGRIDNLILLKEANEKVLVEVKSTKSIDYTKEPNSSHLQQLQLYMHSTGVHKGLLIYVEKNTLKSKEFPVDYDPSEANRIMNRFDSLHKCLKGDVVPIAEAKLDKKMKWLCNYCEYRDECDRE